MPTSREILAAGRFEVSSLQLPLDEPLSPELALVCPELAERARGLLPEPGRPTRLPPSRTTPLQTLAFVLFCVLATLTPLVLVALAVRARIPT